MTTNFKKTFWLALVFIILIAIIFSINYFRNLPTKKKSAFPVLKIDKINKIEIKTGDKTIVLEKKPESWQVGEAKANQDLANSLLEELSKIKDEELVSSNPEKRKVFGVEDSGNQLKVYENNFLVLDLLVGNLSSERFGQYLRKNGQSEVYFAEVNLLSFFNEDFQDKKIE